MRRIIGIALTCVLAGCTYGPEGPVLQEHVEVEPPAMKIGRSRFYYDTVGVPWVHTIPSKRALAYKDVPFAAIAKKVRSCIAMADAKCKCKRFADVTSVLIDYTVIPTPEMEELIDSEIEKIHKVAEHYNWNAPKGMEGRLKSSKRNNKYKKLAHAANENDKNQEYRMYKGQAYLKTYSPRIDGYVMTLSFYTCNKAPPSPPRFVGTAYMHEQSAGTWEGFSFLVQELVEEHVRHPEKKDILLSFD